MKYLIPILLLPFSGSAWAQNLWECIPYTILSGGESVMLSISDDGESGTVQVAGISHKTDYKVEGLNRRWDFGYDEDNYRFAFILEPSGQGNYINFGTNKKEIKKPDQVFICHSKPNSIPAINDTQITPEVYGDQDRPNASRNADEIERVFQKNMGTIFSIYNRQLRKGSSLQGKMVVELTIEPNGIVSRVEIISSELGNKKLEKRLVSKIKKFKFPSKHVPTITVTYPLYFLPS